MPNFHRVVITGIGAVTPIGNNIDEYLVGLQTGNNGSQILLSLILNNILVNLLHKLKIFNPKILLKLKNPKGGTGFHSLGLLQQNKLLMILDLKLLKLMHQELE